MKVYFITRFSIFDPTYRFKTNSRGEMDAEKYKGILYHPQRLATKFYAFFNITYPSVVSQTDNHWEWHIYVGKQMPSPYIDKMKSINHPNIKVIFIEGREDFDTQVAEYDYGQRYATVRLDDDDGLSKKYVSVVMAYRNNIGQIISFPMGRFISIHKNRLLLGARCNKRLLALGLAGVNMNIYAAGDHTLMARKYKIKYCMVPDMYYYFQSMWTDSRIANLIK
jgi:hypothetical protein